MIKKKRALFLAQRFGSMRFVFIKEATKCGALRGEARNLKFRAVHLASSRLSLPDTLADGVA